MRKGGEIMLTAKQEQFAKGIAEGMSQADAYRSAYSCKNMSDNAIYREASLLVSDPKISQRLKELTAMAAKPTIMNAQRRKEWLTEVINNPEVDINARLKASDQLNKMEGEYTQKIEAEVKERVTINISLVDDDE
jgi:phage terminase small subunit